jgi:glycosyltransferase involved in cell wall biosynthesis
MNNFLEIRLGIIQRVLPSYRIPLFDALADAFNKNVSVFAGEPRKIESLNTSGEPASAKLWRGKNVHILDGPLYVCWQSGLIKWLSEWMPNVLIMEANPRYIHSPAALRWMRKQGGKLIGWGLGSPSPQGVFSSCRLSLRKQFIQQFDALITYSSQGASEYAALGFSPDRIFTAPNAAAPRPKHAIPVRSNEYLGGRPILVFVGRLQERKRVDTLIRACGALSPSIQPVLKIIGDGPSRTALEALAKEVYPDTIFYGAKHGADLEQHLRSADIFVLPGTGGLAVQEAMAYALPVIVGEADGTQEDLVRPENGWLLPDISVQTLADTIALAVDDIDSLRKKGAASFRIVDEEINLENMVAVFSMAINKVLED